jgi:glycosyltransferase involved in cell wall biosynthesis
MIRCSQCHFFVRSGSYQGQRLSTGSPCPWCDQPLVRGVQRAPASERVSVVVPFYRGERFLGQLSQTLAAQTYTNFELVLVGDGCDPAAAEGFEILTGFEVLPLAQPKGGIAATTNAGVAAARGEFVLFLDQDDELLPDALGTLAGELHAHSEWGGVYARQELVRVEGTKSWPAAPYRRLGLLEANLIGHPILVRRELAIACPFDPQDDLAQDIGFYLTLSERAQLGFCDEVLYRWHLRDDNPSVTQTKLQQQRMQGAIERAKTRRAAQPTVCFVLPTLSVCGGVRIVLELVNHLAARGWSVSVAETIDPEAVCETAHQDQPPPPRRSFLPLAGPAYNAPPQWADLVIATGWETVAVAQAHEQRGHGRAAWYLQNWEVGWHPNSVKDDPGLDRLACCAPHLQARLAAEWGRSAVVLPSGLDTAAFRYFQRCGTCKPRPSRVLIPWRESPYKHPEALRALAEAVRDSGREPYLMSPHPPSDRAFAAAFEGCWTINPPQERVPLCYGLSDFLVTASRREGHPLVTLEALACGCTPIVGAEGNDQTITGDYGALVESFEPDTYLNIMSGYEADRGRWETLRREGRARAEAFDWSQLVPRWEAQLRAWSC